MSIKPIETRYNGYRFRSRLEARWAVFFDAQGIKWDYEKEGFSVGEYGYYLPDFWLPQVQMWAEVKAETFLPDEMMRCHILQARTKYDVLLLDGMPDFRSYFVYQDSKINEIAGCEYLLNPTTMEISRITDGGYPGEDFYIPVPWQDMIVSNGYLDEHRFYASTGLANWPKPGRWQPGEYTGDQADPYQYQQAVHAARSARFEHGEKPN